MNKILRHKVLSIITILVLLINLLPLPALAVATETSDCIANDACFYSTSASQDAICDPTLGGAAGSGPLYGPHFPKVSDTKALAARLLDYVNKTQPKSVFNNAAATNTLVSLGIKYDVNPAMAIAQSVTETSLGTAGHAVDGKNNVFNIRDGGNGFKTYATLAEGNEAYFSLIKRIYLDPPYNFTTFTQIANKYAPPSDKNDTPGYIKAVEAMMQKMLSGLETSEGASTETPKTTEPTNDTPTPELGVITDNCASSRSAGELGWNITGNNSMVSYDQTDPKYSSHPYGAGKSPIGQSGCGPSSVAMVVATLTGKSNITPITIADKYGDRFHGQGGSSHELFPAAANDYGLYEQALGTDLTKAVAFIKAGGLVIISVDPGHFTNGGHIMVIRAITDDGTGFFLNDPNGDGLSNDSESRSFDAAFLHGQGGMKGLWGYTKKADEQKVNDLLQELQK